jgi:hypothetical protein
VRGGPTERDETELQEQRGDFAQRSPGSRSDLAHVAMIPKAGPWTDIEGSATQVDHDSAIA